MRIHTYWYRRYFILLIIIFSNVLSSIANAEDMGRERAYCYPGSLSNNTTPASFSYNFGTIVVSDVNKMRLALYCHHKSGRLEPIRLIVILLMIMKFTSVLSLE